MARKSSLPALLLSSEQRQRLETLSASRTAPAREVERAKIQLQYAAGKSLTAIHKAVKVSRVTIYHCLRKSLEMGIEAGLKDLFHRPKEAVIDATAKAWVVHLTCSKPKDLGYAAEVWSRQALAAHVRQHAVANGHPQLARAAKATVQRILSEQHLQPHKVKYYLERRDLTGFVDGSENPMLLDAPADALLPDGVPGAAGSVLLLQKWKHRTAEWEALPVAKQELVMGRTKAESIELDNKPADSHVARTDQDKFGNIFRRNMPYGNVDNHGTVFVGFSSEQQRLTKMLESMAGLVDGTRDALTRYTQPLTGAYYFVPSVENLRELR